MMLIKHLLILPNTVNLLRKKTSARSNLEPLDFPGRVSQSSQSLRHVVIFIATIGNVFRRGAYVLNKYILEY